MYFLISYYHEDWFQSYYDRQNDDGRLARYTFTTTISIQDLHVSADTYNPRMYPNGCKTNKVMAQILVRKNSPDPKNPFPTLGEKYFSDWIGYGHVLLKDVPAGNYEIFVQYAWPEDLP